MRVLLITNDLMISSHVEGAAKRQGAQLDVVSYSRAINKIPQEHYNLVAVDLSAATGDVRALRELCPAETTLLAFGPHVHKAKLEEAREAGFDLVLSRGEFHARVDQLLAG